LPNSIVYEEDIRGHIKSPDLSQKPIKKATARVGISLLNNLNKAYELDELLVESQPRE